MVDIYEYNGRKSKIVCCYFDKDYAKVLLRAKVYVDAATKRQKQTDKLTKNNNGKKIVLETVKDLDS